MLAEDGTLVASYAQEAYCDSPAEVVYASKPVVSQLY
jgi:hypothetical protein